MFWLGSGPIRGFAVTLTIGILTSVFSAVTVTRLLVVIVAAECQDQGPHHRSSGLREAQPMLLYPIPVFKGFDFFPHDLRIPFMRYKGICLVLSILFMAASLALYFTVGLNYGVDFKGGSLIEVQSKSGPADSQRLRSKLNSLGLGKVQIQSFGADTTC